MIIFAVSKTFDRRQITKLYTSSDDVALTVRYRSFIFHAAQTALKCDDQIHSLKLLLVRLLKLVLYYFI